MQPARAGPPSQQGRMPLVTSALPAGSIPDAPRPTKPPASGYILQVGVVNAPGFMRTAGQLVQVIAGIAHQGHQLLQLPAIPGAPHSRPGPSCAGTPPGFLSPSWVIFCSISAQFFRRDPEVQLHLPLALGGAHRSGSFFLWMGDFFSGFSAGRGSCFSWRRTEGRR